MMCYIPDLIPSLDTGCKMTEWSQWTSCPTICKTAAQQLRSRIRQIIKKGINTKCPPETQIIQHEKDCVDKCCK